MHTETQKSGDTLLSDSQKKISNQNNTRVLCWVYIRKPQNKPIDVDTVAQKTATQSRQTEVIIVQDCLWSQLESSTRETCPLCLRKLNVTGIKLNNPRAERAVAVDRLIFV